MFVQSGALLLVADVGGGRKAGKAALESAAGAEWSHNTYLLPLPTWCWILLVFGVKAQNKIAYKLLSAARLSFTSSDPIVS